MRSGLLPESIYALDTYQKHFPGALPSEPAELAARVDSLPRAAATELRRVLAQEGGFELINGAYALIHGPGAPGSAKAAVEAARSAGKLAAPGTTVRLHPRTLRTGKEEAARAPRALELPHALTTVREVRDWLLAHGFEPKGQKGSHQHFVNALGRKVTLSVHAGDIPSGTLAAIRRQVREAGSA